MQLMNFSIASKGNVSASQATFFEMRSACSASFLADMTRISKGMNHRACKSGLFPESVLSALYGFFVAAVKDTLGCRLP